MNMFAEKRKMGLMSQLASLKKVKTKILAPDQGFALMIEPLGNLGVTEWSKENIDSLRQSLLEFGAVLLRGFGASIEDFKEVASIVSGSEEMINYVGGNVPRSQVEAGVYNTTEAPPSRVIMLH